MSDNPSIRCMQLPLINMHLLVPNSAVAEIIGYTETIPAGDEVDWLLGVINWRGVNVPVVAFEMMCETENQVVTSPRSRIAIVYNINGDKELPYYGILLQDIPRAYLAEEERMMDDLLPGDCDYLSGKADALQENLFIANLETIQESIKLTFSH